MAKESQRSRNLKDQDMESTFSAVLSQTHVKQQPPESLSRLL